MNIQFIDLKRQYAMIKDDVATRMQGVLDRSAYIMGAEVAELEGELAAFAGTKYAVSCSSGTDALMLALMALDLKAGDEVIVPAFTFIATAEVVALLGAVPVFADIDEKTYNVSVESVKTKITPATKGIIAVDIFGAAADYDGLQALADQNGLWLIQDAAQSFGATYKGSRVPSQTRFGCTSFFPAKPLGCYGDGGMVFCDSKEDFDLMCSFRVHGKGLTKYDNDRVGINGRLDTLQAAVLLAKFPLFKQEIAKRQQVADTYAELFDGRVVVPFVESHNESVFAQYCVRVRDRATVMDALKAKGVPCAIYYPKPLHLQKAFEELGGKKGDLPVCEAVSEDIFGLPMHPYLTRAEQQYIVDAVCSSGGI